MCYVKFVASFNLVNNSYDLFCHIYMSLDSLDSHMKQLIIYIFFCTGLMSLSILSILLILSSLKWTLHFAMPLAGYINKLLYCFHFNYSCFSIVGLCYRPNTFVNVPKNTSQYQTYDYNCIIITCVTIGSSG